MGKKRIMIVEDEGATALTIQSILEDMGYSLSSVEISGEDAVKKAAEDRPDLILMDITLAGEMDGIEAASEIYSRYDIPVVFMSAHSDEKILRRAQKAEPFGYIVKPFQKHELRIVVEIAIYKHQVEQKLSYSEERFREVVEGTNALIASTDGDGKFIYINKTAEQILGIKSEDCVGKVAFHFVHPDDRSLTKEWFNECTQNKISQASIENRQVNQITGEAYNMLWTSHFYYDDKGGVTKVDGIARDITDRKKAENALKISEEQFRGAFNTAAIGMALLSPEGRWLRVNPALCEIVGYSEKELLSLTFQDITYHEDLESDLEYVRKMLAGEIQHFHMEKRYIHKKGHIVWILLSVSLVRDERGHPLHFVSQIQNITKRKQAQEELNERVKLAELNADIGVALTTGETLHDILEICAQALVLHLNALFARIWVFNEEENILELNASAGLYTRLDGSHSRKSLGNSKIGIIASKRKPLLTNNVAKDPYIVDKEWAKREGIVAFAGHPLVVGDRLKGVMGLFSRYPLTEITTRALASVADIIALGIERKAMEEQLHSAAITDSLTGLFNRRGFFTLAGQQCKLADRTKRYMSLLYLDLDGFKTINDELGHKTGDQALRETANILKKTFRESDIIARLGGDEFVVLLTEPSEFDIDRIIISHVQKNVKIHNEQPGREYVLLLSMGISHYDPDNPCSIGDLLDKADILMFEDKKYHKQEKKIARLVKKINTERRIYKRYRTEDNSWAELDISGKVTIKDISLGGVCLETSKQLGADIIYKIKMFTADNEEISLSGVVVRSSQKERQAVKGVGTTYYESGIKFLEFGTSIKSSLEKVITGFNNNI